MDEILMKTYFEMRIKSNYPKAGLFNNTVLLSYYTFIFNV